MPEERITQLEIRMASHEASCVEYRKSTEKGIANNATKIDKVEAKVDGVESRVDRMEVRIAAILALTTVAANFLSSWLFK